MVSIRTGLQNTKQSANNSAMFRHFIEIKLASFGL
jgi:hypothetical protein